MERMARGTSRRFQGEAIASSRPVSRPGDPRVDGPVAAAGFAHANLPNRLSRMVGRDDDVLKLSARLNASRFVTIVGAGGVGKTTVAVAVGHHLVEAFFGAVLFVDLGMIGDPGLVSTAVASMLGLSVQSNDCYAQSDRVPAQQADPPDPRHVRASRGDGGALGRNASSMRRRRSTSWQPAAKRFGSRASISTGWTRLPIRRTIPDSRRRSCGPSRPRSCSSSARSRAARVWTSATRRPCSSQASAASSTAWRSAIELAARRVESYGLQQTAALLDQRLTLLWLGSRTAPPRQQTLQATLDWSFGLLTDLERVVLRRLAVFVGHFTLDAALEVVTSATLDREAVLRAMDTLVAKSIVATRPIGAMMRYRLLDTTRAYVLEYQDRRRRGGRPGRAPRRLLSTMAGADWDRMARLDDGRGTNAPFCRHQQCQGGPGMVLRPRWRPPISALDWPPLPRRSSWRCPCCPNVIAGRNEPCSLSMTPLSVGPTRCIFRPPSACP